MGYINLCSLDDMNLWTQISNFGYYANWNLQIFVTNQLGKEIPLLPVPPVEKMFQDKLPDRKNSQIKFSQ
jgi:hypothetical protein